MPADLPRQQSPTQRVTESVCETRRCRGCGSEPSAHVKLTDAGNPYEVIIWCPNGCATGATVFAGSNLTTFDPRRDAR